MEAPEQPIGSPAPRRSAIPWRAVFTQLVTIIAGVLIALAAQAWWSARQDRDKEVRYLQALRADIITTRDRMTAGIAHQDSAMQQVDRMIQLLRSSGEVPPVDSIRRWNSSSTDESWRPMNGTLRAMMSTGDIGLVRDDSLQIAISDYAARLEWVAAALSRHETEYLSRFTVMRDRITPYIVRPVSRWQDPYANRSTADFDVAAMRKDLQLQSAFVNIRVSYINYRNRYVEIRDAADKLVKMMERRTQR